jgi:hypothetical protein
MTVLSTTSCTDLSLHNTDLIRFSRELPGVPEERFLTHAFKWFVGSRSGCSCDLRHLSAGSIELGFGEPEEWFPEESDEIDATRNFSEIVRNLVSLGEQVDCVDAWASDGQAAASLAGDIEVNLSAIRDTEFRFFERHRFTFI